jgi:acetylornithine deacetylase/succinyl-diaminopimelate desuccinylase-like protein
MNGEEEIIKVFDGVYRDVMSRKPLYEYANGITDANIFSGEGGIPCLHLGPQRGGAHQKNEYVHLDWLPLISKMFTLIAVRFFD